ncbi:hypothetical protein V8G54_017435 [Vigna mungo]|uniref:Uncharacterized protein n=1 Tax=Vigna mungo TaxID=3915 RepID=A0AAQ3NN64_VIGMU
MVLLVSNLEFFPFKSSSALTEAATALDFAGKRNETALLDESATAFGLSFFPLSQIFDTEKLSFLFLPIAALFPSQVVLSVAAPPLAASSSTIVASKTANLKSLLDSQSHSDIAGLCPGVKGKPDFFLLDCFLIGVRMGTWSEELSSIT